MRGFAMKRFIEGESRNQITLMPACLDDYIDTDNPVRVIDLFVDELDLVEVTIPRQSRGHSVVSRSKRLVGVANAAPHSWSHRFGGDSSP